MNAVQLTFEPDATRYAFEAQRYILANPAFWRYLTEAAHEAYHAGRRFSVKRAVEDARYDLPELEPDASARINNNHAAAFARLLLDDYPYLAKCIATRHAPMTERSRVYGRGL